MKEFINQIQSVASLNKIKLNDKQAELFYKYMEILLDWNQKINLTAITEKEDIILKHFIDCITILPYLNEKDKLIDIGTGAGFPGIPIKIMNKKIEIILMDSLNKRIKFLDEVIKKLELENITTIHARAEELARNRNQREKYDIATSRAVAKLNTLLEYMLPFVKIGGKCICMKSNNIEEELDEAKKAIEVLGGKIERIEEISLANTDIVRKIVIIKKVKATPKEFPRKAGTPTKNPIQ